MKNHVIRESTGEFKKSVIVTDNIEELKAIKMGIDILIQENMTAMEFYRTLVNDIDREVYTETILRYEENINMLNNMNENLSAEYEIPIEKFIIKTAL